MALIDFDKFLASFITEMKECSQMRNFSIPRCIKKALVDQGLEYKNGEIVKIQSKVSAESEDEKIRQFLTHAWLEKQGNPNTEYWKGYKDGKKAILDKYSETHKVVEPKFKVGDWVASDYNNVAYIESISERKYNLRCKDGYHEKISIEYIDRCWHLWSIKDAKPGDVLAIDPWSDYPSSFVAIYKKQNEEDFDSYCFVGFDGKFYKGENGHSTEDIHPATKEQRDMLFQKMHESGYEWGAEKKELRKIKQNPTEWIEEDERTYKSVLYAFEHNYPLNHEQQKFIKSFKDRVLPQTKEMYKKVK